MTDRKEEQHGEQKEGEDQQLVFMEEGRRAQQEELVGTEQAEESQATSPLQPSPPPPLPPRHATEAMEREQGKGGEHRGKENMQAQAPPPPPLPPPPEVSMPVDDVSLRRGHVEE